MNSDYEKILERAIDGELAGLPEVAAPGTLVPRVMAVLARQGQAAWYRQPWQSWPLPVRAASLVILLALLGGLCFVGSSLPQAARFAAARDSLAGGFVWLAAIGHTLSVLFCASALVMKHIGTALMVCILVAVGLAYAFCVGLGTVYLRLAFARP